MATEDEVARAKAWAYSGTAVGVDVLTKAHNAALDQMATARGLASTDGKWSYASEATCTAVTDTANTPAELRWWDPEKKRCVAGSAESVQWCKDNGNLDWVADPASGIAACKLTEGFCASRGTHLVDGDCRVDFATWLLEMFVGSTIARGMNWVMENPDRALEGAVKLALAATDLAYSSVAEPLMDIIASGKLEELPGAVMEMILKGSRMVFQAGTKVINGGLDLVENLANALDSVCPSQVCGPLKALIPIQAAWKLFRAGVDGIRNAIDDGFVYLTMGVEVVFDAIESVVPIGQALDFLGLTPVLNSSVGLVKDYGGKAAGAVKEALGDVYDAIHLAEGLNQIGQGVAIGKKAMTQATREAYVAMRNEAEAMAKGIDDKDTWEQGGPAVVRIRESALPAIGQAGRVVIGAIGGAISTAVGAIASAFGGGGGGIGATDIKSRGLAAECLCNVPWNSSVGWSDVTNCNGMTRSQIDAFSDLVNGRRPNDVWDLKYERRVCGAMLDGRLASHNGYDGGDVQWSAIRARDCMRNVRARLPYGQQMSPAIASFICTQGVGNDLLMTSAFEACVKRGVTQTDVARAVAQCAVSTDTQRFDDIQVSPAIEDGVFRTGVWRRSQMTDVMPWLGCEYQGPLDDHQLPFSPAGPDGSRTYAEFEEAKTACGKLPDCSGITQIGAKEFVLRRDATPTPLKGVRSWLRQPYEDCMARASGTDPMADWDGPHANAQPLGGVILTSVSYNTLEDAVAAASTDPLTLAIVDRFGGTYERVQGGMGATLREAWGVTTWRRRKF
jgi:hypothetical protein